MEKLVVHNMGKNLGDFFFIELEKNNVKCVIMVDGHTVKNGFTKEVKCQLGRYERIDYLIVTHVDGDHIKGISKFWKSERFRRKFKDTVIIYNYVTKKLVNYKDAYKFEKMIDGHYVVPTGRDYYVNISNELMRIISLKKRTKFDVCDGLAYLTLIAPDRRGIQSVYEDYCAKLRKAGDKIENISQPNTGITNHNSIVFLLEFAGKKMLFMGDNDIDQIEPLIDGLKNMETAKIDLIKVGHHGAWDENKRLVKFAEKHKCNKLIVTGEEIWGQKHPDIKIMEELNASEMEEVCLYAKVDFGSTTYSNIVVDGRQEIVILKNEDDKTE